MSDEPTSPFDKQSQDGQPGRTGPMDPARDHGERSDHRSGSFREDARDTQRLVEEAGRKGAPIGGGLESGSLPGGDRGGGLGMARADVLVNKAAFQRTHSSIEKISDEEWDHTFDVNSAPRRAT